MTDKGLKTPLPPVSIPRRPDLELLNREAWPVGLAGGIFRFFGRALSFARDLFVRERLEPLPQEERLQPPPRKGFVKWVLERETLPQDAPSPRPARRSLIGWILSGETLPQDEPLKTPPKPSILSWVLRSEQLSEDKGGPDAP